MSAAAAYTQRAASGGSLGDELLNWQAQMAKHWPMARFGSATVEQNKGQYLFQAQVFLGDLDPNAVRAELYADGQNGGDPPRDPMNRGERLVGSANGFLYTARIPAARPAADFTVRLIPQHRCANVPLESPYIMWNDSPSWR